MRDIEAIRKRNEARKRCLVTSSSTESDCKYDSLEVCTVHDDLDATRQGAADVDALLAEMERYEQIVSTGIDNRIRELELGLAAAVKENVSHVIVWNDRYGPRPYKGDPIAVYLVGASDERAERLADDELSQPGSEGAYSIVHRGTMND